MMIERVTFACRIDVKYFAAEWLICLRFARVLNKFLAGKGNLLHALLGKRQGARKWLDTCGLLLWGKYVGIG